jgi:integrase
VERYEIHAFELSDALRLLDAARGERLEALYSVALSLGLRRGEILGLRWQDLDLQQGTLTVRQAAQRLRGQGIKFAPPKTERARRSMVIPSPLVAALRIHRKQQLEDRLKAGSRWRELDLVFASKVGTAIEPRNLDRHFKRMLEKAELSDMRFHDLRHAAASLLLAQNVDPRTLMDILGHSRISVTLDTYAHVMPAAMHEAANKISSVLWNQN